MRAHALLIAFAANAASQPATCDLKILNNTGLKEKAYTFLNVSSLDACCSACTADTKCVAFTLREGVCGLKNAWAGKTTKNEGTTAGVKPATPTPPPTPQPTPGPVPAGTQKNIIFILTDDQDLQLGSMRAMPSTLKFLGAGGANLSNHFVNTPICCPSRATIISGNYAHNNRVAAGASGGCMHMNTGIEDNPEFWPKTFIPALHKLGYQTGMFGKLLNSMGQYGCDSGGVPEGWDSYFAMCNPAFFKEQWATNNGTINTGTKPEEYTTSLIGNKTMAFIKSVMTMGKTHPPFFAYVAPHAPHLPCTPAPWYADHPIGMLKAPITEHYNYSALDHHPLIANQPILTTSDASKIDAEYSKRMRSLLSVDDIVHDIVAYLSSPAVDELKNTYIFYTSDHGYSQGQFRITSHKTQIYDHVTRVPMLVQGPGVVPGSQVPQITEMADIGPTLIELAGGSPPSYMDGKSFAHFLAPSLYGQSAQHAATWHDTALIEYWSIRPTLTAPNPFAGDSSDTAMEHASQDWPFVGANHENAEVEAQSGSGIVWPMHYHDGPNNTFIMTRTINQDTGVDLIYAEFTNINCPKCWDFPDGTVLFYELYNMTVDPFMKHNLYKDAPADLKENLHTRLHTLFTCKGSGSDAGACP